MAAETASTGERSSVYFGEGEPQDNLPDPVVPAPDPIPQVRRMYATKAMVEKYGMTTGCAACLRIITHGATNEFSAHELLAT